MEPHRIRAVGAVSGAQELRKRRPRTDWLHEDTVLLLDAMRDLRVLRRLDARRERKRSIFESVRVQMASRGVAYSTDAIMNRWKNLLDRYRFVRKGRESAGPRAPSWPLYDKVEETLASRCRLPECPCIHDTEMSYSGRCHSRVSQGPEVFDCSTVSPASRGESSPTTSTSPAEVFHPATPADTSQVNKFKEEDSSEEPNECGHLFETSSAGALPSPVPEPASPNLSSHHRFTDETQIPSHDRRPPIDLITRAPGRKRRADSHDLLEWLREESERDRRHMTECMVQMTQTFAQGVHAMRELLRELVARVPLPGPLPSGHTQHANDQTPTSNGPLSEFSVWRK
uniref:uncharacterized protein n=1 Tax=Myxine glutinosa TaxID=7769 RepID=UPI00358EB1F6